MKTHFKKFAIAFAILAAPFAHADLNTQMSNILGDWDVNGLVVRFQQQSSNSVKIFYCNRAKYLENNGYCAYQALEIGVYNSTYDGFCIALNGHSCTNGMQVSVQYPNQLIYMIDPLNLGLYNNSGHAVQGTKR